MPSPFPGMDPYLESPDAWHDLHVRYVPALAGALIRALPDRYITKVDQDIYIRERSAEQRALVGKPDVMVVARGQGYAGSGAATGSTAAGGVVVAPVEARVPPAIDVERRPFFEIIDRARRSVVTVVELLSPSNKSNPADRAAYLAKRQQLQSTGTHLVEIDLLRGGRRMPLEGLPPCDYYAMVSRAERRPSVDVWPIAIRDPLPVLPVPLVAGDPDLALDLRAVMDQVYEAAGYARYIYDNPLEPPLPPIDAAWASDRVASVARR